jgi:hypothetical protein
MEEWKNIVRDLKDEYKELNIEPRVIENICQKIFHDLLKIKKLDKFEQRTGPDFELWAFSLEPAVIVEEIINNDLFWITTIATVRTQKR